MKMKAVRRRILKKSRTFNFSLSLLNKEEFFWGANKFLFNFRIFGDKIKEEKSDKKGDGDLVFVELTH